MMRPARLAMLAIAFSTIALSPTLAAAPPGGESERSAGLAVGLELWTSTDSDHTDVIKLLGRGLWKFEGGDEYQGIAVEHVWFRPQGGKTREEDRLYLDLADDLGSKWRWKARVGTDGHTVLGSASLRTSDWRREFFIEREIVETPLGLDKGVYYTFAGASLGFPAGERDTFNTTAAVQEFTGKNVRLHLRGNYVHVVKPALGLSVQLRTRYFHSTEPGEFDYYSPRNFYQAIPVAQMRRFDSAGWMYLVALGYGVQKATGTGWQSARLADLRIESPARGRRFQEFAGLQYSNNSLSEGGSGYHYVAARAGLTARF
jgi:hypothetical protein